MDRNWTSVPGNDQIDVVRAFELRQNHPNPFNPVTTISFAIPKPGVVRVNIYDIAGRLVRRLLTKEYAAPGRDSVVWNGLDQNGKAVSSGVYFYRLEADEFSATRKMLLLK